MYLKAAKRVSLKNKKQGKHCNHAWWRMLTRLTVLILLQHICMYRIGTLYTWNSHNVICQLYLTLKIAVWDPWISCILQIVNTGPQLNFLVMPWAVIDHARATFRDSSACCLCTFGSDTPHPFMHLCLTNIVPFWDGLFYLLVHLVKHSSLWPLCHGVSLP